MPDESEPRNAAVGIVVVTWNSADVLEKCLESVADACAGVGSWVVVVADNDSSDDTVAMARSTPDVSVVVLDANHGYAAGINAGAAALGSCDAILVLNADIRLAPGCVRTLLDAAADPGVGITVPRLLFEDGTTIASLRRDPTVVRVLGETFLGGDRAGRIPWLGELVKDPETYERPATADWATGAAMLITASCWESVGEWDESYFLYSEETDYAIRARRAGFRLEYVPEAGAVHIGGDQAVAARLWTMSVLNRVRVYGRFHGRLRTLAFRVAVVLNEATRAAAGRERSRAALKALLRPSARPAELQ